MKNNINNIMSNNTKKIEEVALYIRVSTEEQALNGDSLRTQKEELTKYALANHFHITGIYEDDGFSATNLKRPALQKMLEDVKKGKINRILITKLDRLSRGVRNYYKILDVLDENDVYWTTVFEKYDSSTANGRLHINIMLSVAENESAQTSERIRSVFKTKVNQKEIISGKIPIGYKKDGKKIIVDENQRAFIIDIFEYFLKSSSVYKTSEYINLHYFSINYARTRYMLSNKMYIGIKQCRYGDIEDFCEPIISKEMFIKVQNILAKNVRKRTAKSGGFIFTGLLKCPVCGHKLSGKFAKDMPPTCSYYYMCNNNHLNKKCSNSKYLNEVKIEKKLLDIIVPQINEYITTYTYKKINIKKVDNSKEISLVNKQLEKLRDLYINDLIQLEHYEKQYKELSDKLDILTKNLVVTKTQPEESNLENLKSILNSDFLLIYSTLSREQKRQIWLSIINYIEIDSNYNIKLFFI